MKTVWRTKSSLPTHGSWLSDAVFDMADTFFTSIVWLPIFSPQQVSGGAVLTPVPGGLLGRIVKTLFRHWSSN